MKKTMIFGVLVAGIYLASCNTSEVTPTDNATTTASAARTAAKDSAGKGGSKDAVAIKDLPTIITAYIKATYPTAVIKHAGKTPAGGYVVISQCRWVFPPNGVKET